MRIKGFLLMLCIFCLLAPSAFGLQVAAKGSGVAVYAQSNAEEPVGVIYNGYRLSALSEQENGRTACAFPNHDGVVWVNREAAQENIPETWYADSRMTARKKLEDMPCEIFLAEVVMEGAPLYGDWQHETCTSTQKKGTLVRVCGQIGADYLVDNASVYSVKRDLAGFMPVECLRKIRTLSYPQASSPDYGLEDVKTATVYTDGQELAIAYSATGQCALPPRVLRDGEKVKVLREGDGWAQLQDGGFVESRFLEKEGDHSIPLAIVKASHALNRVNVRSEADASARAVVKLWSGAKVQVPSVMDGWASVYLTGATGSRAMEGCMMLEYLAFEGEAVENACPVVRLNTDVFADFQGNGFGIDKPYSRHIGEKLPAGTEMTVVGIFANSSVENGENYVCQLEDGRVIALFDEGGFLEPLAGTGITVKVNTGVKLRVKAEKEAKSLRTLSNGTQVEVMLRGEGWTMVRYKDQTGYVMSRYLNFP